MNVLLRYLLPLALLGSVTAAELDPWGKPIPVEPWTGEQWPMRMRVCADYANGVACRVPYHLLPKDQSVAAYFRQRPKVVFRPLKTKTVTGQAMVDREVVIEWEEVPSLRLVSEPAKGVPADLAAVGDRLAGATLAWEPYDYYAASPKRAFAVKPWAPPGVTAMIGSGEKCRALVLHQAGACSAVVLAGELAERAELLDLVEVMGTQKRARMTWAESLGVRGIPLGPDGAPAKGAREAVPWEKGYEVETRHYHVTGNTTPVQLAARARDLEALYASYEKFFETKDTAPLKFEVHIVDTWDNFQALSTACDRPLEVPSGSVLGGFFVPMAQSLWVYEESGKLGGPSMAIEHVMCHECSHQFLHMACNGSDHVPTWINEGIAVHFENGILAGGRYQHRPPVDRIKRLAGIYRQLRTTIQPMNTYLDHHGHIGADLYAEVYAMVHFWAFESPDGSKRFRELWKALRTGEDGLKAFERIFIADMVKVADSRQKALDNWREHLTTYVLRKLSKLQE